MTELGAETRRAARRLRWATLFGITLTTLVCLFGAVTLAFGPLQFEPIVVGMNDGLQPRQKACLLLAIGALLMVALLRLAAMLRGIEAGRIFPASSLRGFAFYLFLAILASVAGPPLIQLAGALIAGTGQVELSLDGGEALLLFVTGLLFFVARLLDEAQAIADDASQIV